MQQSAREIHRENSKRRREHGMQSPGVVRSSDTDSYINIYKGTGLRQGPIVLQRVNSSSIDGILLLREL